MKDHNWTPHPEATHMVQNDLNALIATDNWLNKLQVRLLIETGTRLFDWIDRVSVQANQSELEGLGFRVHSKPGDLLAMRCLSAQLPWVVPRGAAARNLVVIRVESILDFANAHGIDRRNTLLGHSLGAVRRLLIHESSELEVWAVERHGSWDWNRSKSFEKGSIETIDLAERFRLRCRRAETIEVQFAELNRDIELAIDQVGVPRAADQFFAAERSYWQARNTAGQIQKMRQDRLGLGWANHDHHTYRSSRPAFRQLIGTFERLGFECRESFYAGRDAGWGAQVMEQPDAGLVVFADVDLMPDEIVQDFAHQTLVTRATLGTVGLWCALHGEAIFEAGMHHLECQFSFDAARLQLSHSGVPSMKPFTDLQHLRQSFTVGEVWPVQETRIDAALTAGWINQDQANQFRRQGAIGSHLEILERNDGFKGFNPKGISEIILDTDPRHQNK